MYPCRCMVSGKRSSRSPAKTPCKIAGSISYGRLRRGIAISIETMYPSIVSMRTTPSANWQQNLHLPSPLCNISKLKQIVIHVTPCQRKIMPTPGIKIAPSGRWSGNEEHVSASSIVRYSQFIFIPGAQQLQESSNYDKLNYSISHKTIETLPRGQNSLSCGCRAFFSHFTFRYLWYELHCRESPVRSPFSVFLKNRSHFPGSKIPRTAILPGPHLLMIGSDTDSRPGNRISH